MSSQAFLGLIALWVLVDFTAETHSAQRKSEEGGKEKMIEGIAYASDLK